MKFMFYALYALFFPQKITLFYSSGNVIRLWVTDFSYETTGNKVTKAHMTYHPLTLRRLANLNLEAIETIAVG